jgi:uncharacterized membrane protein SirB2
MLLLLYIAIALLVGVIALFRPPQLPRAVYLLGLACVPQILAMLGVRHWLLALTGLVLCLLWYRANPSLSGALLLVAGIVLNLGTMVLHGGSMPITTATLAALGVELPPGTVIMGSKDTVVEHSPIWWLGDWIRITTPWRNWIISPGDLLVAAGLLRWLLATNPGKEKSNAPYAPGLS